MAPTTPVRLSGNVPALMLDLQSGRCDAVVYDAPVLATLKARTPQRFGEFIGVIPTGEEYGIALPRGSALLGPVNRALGALIANGTVDRLSKKWLSIDTRRLRLLR